MIFVDRNAVDENGDSIRPNDDWFDDAAEITADAIAECDAHDVDDDVYAHAEVRKSLEKLFFDKCAYCEWKPTGGSDWDVEHYRPKGRVYENAHHPGYYWLAYTWANLFLSCTHCNQKRKDKPRWDDPTTGASAGKLDQFPIEDENNRVFNPGDDVSAEGALLIDPCVDDPEDFIGFDINGEAFAIGNNLRGSESIRVFALNRRRLRDLRRQRVALVIIALRGLRRSEASGDQRAIDDFRQFLDTLQASDWDFAGVARYVEFDPDAFGV